FASSFGKMNRNEQNSQLTPKQLQEVSTNSSDFPIAAAASFAHRQNLSAAGLSRSLAAAMRGKGVSPHFLNTSDSGCSIFWWIVGLGKNCGWNMPLQRQRRGLR